jgi:HTH-type transcriptional regulator / antitoxin HipB
VDYPVKTPLQLRPLLVGFRKAAGLTQARVASHLGITQQTYAQLEAKPESASMDRLFQVLKLLGVDLVLTQTRAPAKFDLTPERRTADAPPASKHVESMKRTPRPTGTAAPRKPTTKTTDKSASATPKPVARKRVTPKAPVPKKREDW